MLRHLQQCNAQAPHVRSDGIRLPCDALGRHIVACAYEGICVALGAKFAADAEVAEFYFAVAAQEDVAGFDVSVDDFPAVEVGEAIQDTFSDLTEDFFAGAATKFLDFAVDAVEGAAFTEFHRNADGAADVVELTVVFTDVFRGAFFVEGELALDLFFDVGVRVGGYDLKPEN